MAYEWINVREVKRQRRSWGEAESPCTSLPLSAPEVDTPRTGEKSPVVAPAESAVISIAGEEGTHGLQPTDVNLNSDPNDIGPVADGSPDGEDPPPDASLCPYCGKKSEKTGAWCLSCQEDLHCPRVDPSDSENEDGSPPRPTGPVSRAVEMAVRRTAHSSMMVGCAL